MAYFDAAITDETAVISLMWANNETGLLFPVKQIAEICRARGVPHNCNAFQAAGKVEINLRNVPIDYLSLTGHKFHAPKGIGSLYISRKTLASPFIHGGHRNATCAVERKACRSLWGWVKPLSWPASIYLNTTRSSPPTRRAGRRNSQLDSECGVEWPQDTTSC